MTPRVAGVARAQFSIPSCGTLSAPQIPGRHAQGMRRTAVHGGVSISAIRSAAAGMTLAMNQLGGVAAKAAAGDMDVSTQAVELAQAKTTMRANVAVVRAADQMMGTLLDILG